VLKLSHFISLSLSHTLGYLEFPWSTLGGCGKLGFLEQEGKGRAGKRKKAPTLATTSDLPCSYRVAHMISSLVWTCMWILGHGLSLAWRIAWIGSGLPRLAISWIGVVIVGLFPMFCFGWFSCFLSSG